MNVFAKWDEQEAQEIAAEVREEFSPRISMDVALATVIRDRGEMSPPVEARVRELLMLGKDD